MDHAGGYVALGIKEYREVWAELHDKYADLLSANGRDLAWHERQILEKDDYGTGFHLDRLVRKRPDDPEPLARRAGYLRQKGMLVEALADYNRAVQLSPSETELYRGRGTTLLDMGEWRKAVDDLTNARASPEPTLSRRDALREVAGRLTRDRHYTDALKCYDEAVAIGPATRELLWGRGLTYHEMGDWQRAIIDLEAGLDERNAFDAYVAAIVACQANDAHRYRLVCRRLLGGLHRFLKVENAVERWNSTFYIAWSCILADHATEDWDPLIRPLRAYADEEKKSHSSISINACLLLGAVLYRSGDYADAIDFLEQTEIHPYDWLFMAMAHDQRGSRVESARFFGQAHDLLDKTLRAENKEQRRYGDPWRWIICELLEAEAQQMLESQGRP